MPGRSFSATNQYRYGFNGKEKTDEISSNGYDFGARIYDGRLGRWLSIDLKSAKYPQYTPYNFVINNPLNVIDPDGKDIIFLIAIAEKKANANNNMFIKSAETRKKDIESGKGFNVETDMVIILQVQDLSTIKQMVNEKVAEFSPKYGKTREVDIYSHNGEFDGPIGEDETSKKEYAVDSKQMSVDGWEDINWNWKTGNNNTMTLFGCNAAKNRPGWKNSSFAAKLSNGDNMKDVSVSGLNVSSFPSMYTDKRVYTNEMAKNDFSKVEKVYMVGSDGGFGDLFFNGSYLFINYKNMIQLEPKGQQGSTAPKVIPKNW